MWSELITRIPWSRAFPVGWVGKSERTDAIAAEPTFDIFRRLRHGPEFVETVRGLAEACDRMKQIAKQKPGVRYFVADTKTHQVVAEVDATVRVKRKWRRVTVR